MKAKAKKKAKARIRIRINPVCCPQHDVRATIIVKLIAGLGNPGTQYARTRHNLGFITLDVLAAELGVSFTRVQDEAQVVRAHYAGSTVMLVKPQTYMNNSGRAVATIARRNGCEADDILVIVDDKDLPLGKIRLRNGGSAGGHNGLKSITECLGTDAYPRLRMGIATEFMSRMDELSDYVLSRFQPEEMKSVTEMTQQAMSAAVCWIENGIESAMNRFN